MLLVHCHIAGLSALMTHDGSTTGDIFLAYLEHVLLPTLNPGQTIVLDNLTAHKVSAVRTLVEIAKCHLLYLPPYSPDFNPIEYAWAFIKKHIEGVKFNSRDDFDKRLVYEANYINSYTAVRWILRTGYRVCS